MPTAPDPAYKSSTDALSMRGANTLKSVSRSRSLVGRVASPEGAKRERERKDPAIMRITNQHTGSAAGRKPLQSTYARLVNTDGPLDGR
jgi:hypothetical protein